MIRFKKLSLIAAPMIAIAGLSACATPFKAEVARFQQLPAPAGQTFSVVADDPRLAGGLEFQHYANQIGDRLKEVGYVASNVPGKSDLIVRVAYDVDNGREKIRTTNFGYDPYWGPGWGYGPRWGGRWGRSWGMGFYDPWLFGAGGYNDVTSYTVYTSELTVKIDRAVDNLRLFEGKASARSLSNKLNYLVPNLIDSMFTNFPGQNGENIQITLPPEKKS